MLSGLTLQDLRRGLGRLSRDEAAGEWPPNAKEFRALCVPRPEELGLPDSDQAWEMAVRRDWSHPIVWFARRAVGSHAMQHSPEARLLFCQEYHKLIWKAAQGEVFEIPQDKPQLSHNPAPEATASPEEARAQVHDYLHRHGLR